MTQEGAIAKRKRRREFRLSVSLLGLPETICWLKYIADVDQADPEYGGFNDHAILTARSALHHIRRLRDEPRKN